MRRIIIALAFMLLPITCFALDGKVVGVSDGDTITLLTKNNQQVKVRLYGVDCPESHQDYGQKAKQFTSDLVFGKTVDLEKIEQDKYGRTVGIVKADGKILNEELLKNGYAWQYSQYCKRAECNQWKQLEGQARDSKFGLWAGKDPIAPWDFRHGTKTEASNKPINAASAVKFHGNANSHAFHAPGCRYYDCGNCTASFASREEAVKAGYRPCGVCRP